MEHGKEWPLVPSKTVANSGAQFTHAEVLPPNFPDATPINAQQFHCAVEMREWSGWGTFKAVLSHWLSLGTWINHSPTIAVSKYCPVWDWILCLVALSPGRGPEMLGSNNVISLMHGCENDHLKLHSLTHKIRKINYPFVYFCTYYLVGMCIYATWHRICASWRKKRIPGYQFSPSTMYIPGFDVEYSSAFTFWVILPILFFFTTAMWTDHRFIFPHRVSYNPGWPHTG